ncbi:MAG: Rrf2 family transcriptional regulator [Fusobacterium gastrosuis]|uniref:Rrf2 family transcriptional regulator n=1 Tax=Fusobacterium TaxID=848 RepID=UPI001F4FBFF2|nr:MULTISPECIES: Rrf2 family transcriptional regulator [Fusobacterium]MDD7392614.1 Rrf2 family transcriptional regulator [Fusobacteriaceae bacterium]MCI5725152.1 Rrf2 family transcriptional regulator [Fusobacterium sp.]MCI7223489.1 Rrf2 family transcriptional regulator [Fusobacterium sp.]MDD7411361.1 Rrf2 family transcriptional regulator [Fusobacteriaceae bacterium]MDY4010879.1 Rrf2 family transcriptional regulator [Fusobacterium gastrosuis]
MKIKNEVRYALQIIYYLTLHRDKEIISSNEISIEENIPRLFCLRIIKKLEKAGIVKIYRGAKGGYSLSRDPKRLTFRDIIEIIDDDIVLQPCIDSETICSRRGTDCNIRRALKYIQEELLNDFDKINFYDLVKNNL